VRRFSIHDDRDPRFLNSLLPGDVSKSGIPCSSREPWGNAILIACESRFGWDEQRRLFWTNAPTAKVTGATFPPIACPDYAQPTAPLCCGPSACQNVRPSGAMFGSGRDALCRAHQRRRPPRSVPESAPASEE